MELPIVILLLLAIVLVVVLVWIMVGGHDAQPNEWLAQYNDNFGMNITNNSTSDQPLAMIVVPSYIDYSSWSLSFIPSTVSIYTVSDLSNCIDYFVSPDTDNYIPMMLSCGIMFSACGRLLGGFTLTKDNSGLYTLIGNDLYVILFPPLVLDERIAQLIKDPLPFAWERNIQNYGDINNNKWTAAIATDFPPYNNCYIITYGASYILGLQLSMYLNTVSVVAIMPTGFCTIYLSDENTVADPSSPFFYKKYPKFVYANDNVNIQFLFYCVDENFNINDEGELYPSTTVTDAPLVVSLPTFVDGIHSKYDPLQYVIGWIQNKKN